MARPMIVGNWKMNTSIRDAKAISTAIRAQLAGVDKVDVVVCPPFPYLFEVKQCLDGCDIQLGAQNIYHEGNGAFTGEISGSMVREMCDYVIIGHSERRQFLGETDEMINRKVLAALAVGLKPIICVGEDLNQRQQGTADIVIRGQVNTALKGVESIRGIAIAYEPVWAIGTGVPATPEIAGDIMGNTIADALNVLFDKSQAAEAPLLYGGSVNPENIKQFILTPFISGALVGGASLQPEMFSQIALNTQEFTCF